ncbi:hypothetical protein VN97_g6239 [Penicillium thymicola]|uniref:Carrier domain-containing protein n=1 Tax=Penicillium thymicola TaxID=293382 RepID=A0AAI9X7N9_PENTH|nr:hypothetical protein VN97_g6239 [Penicillium thymicola]
MNFQSLNIERRPVDQGLKLGTYDLIFAGNVIHATANLQNALQNLRSLLKPGGQLVMQEGIRQDFLWYPLVFGQLSGWWLGDEPCRQWCPYIPAIEWNPLLLNAGFSGIDIEYPSSNDPDLTWQSILVSSAIELPKKKSSNTAVILTIDDLEGEVIENLQGILPELGYMNILVKEPAELENPILQDALYISLIDLESPYLFDMNEVEYTRLKKLLSECQNLLWVTRNPISHPHASMSLGLLRTVRWERDADGSNIVILTEAEPGSEIASPENLTTAIGKIVKRQFVDKPENDRHAEYMLQNGLIHIGRLNEWEAADQFLAAQSSQQAPQLQRLGEYNTPIHLHEAAVSTGEYHWVIDTQHEESCKATEIEIEIRAIGLSSDISAGHLANEIAGVVSKVGPEVEGPALGDRVIYILGDKKGGSVRTHGRNDQLHLVRIPDEISFEVAAGLAWAYVTAIQGLGEIAHLAPENTILIHTSASDICQAAIQYAHMIGATIYATVGTVEERDLLVSDYGIPQDRIFSRRDLSFVKGIMRCTQNTGVDVVFNALSGQALRGSIACLAPFGTFIDVSNPDLRADTTVELTSLPRNVSVHTVDILLLAQHRPESVRLLLIEALRLYSEGKISQLRTTSVMDFTQIKEGIRAAQSGKAAKVVIAPNPSNVVPVVPRPLSPCHFDPCASYVLAGGYGGLGRSLARWMASRGATSLIILSRSSASSPEKVELIADLDKMGCKVHSLACDVADISSLQQLSGDGFSNLPPIKGCIQGSMVLRDGAFAGLSFKDWQAAIKPKVQGSWNLHKVLPNNMDFFIMLSSVAGIFGNRGQSNYAAGNTFQDALAAYRVSKGMKAASINLGSVSNVGWVAENRSSMRTHTATLFELLREEEVHAAVEFLIRDQQDGGNASSRSQLVLGLPTAEMCRQNAVPLPSYLNYSMFTHSRNTMPAKSSEVAQQKTVSIAALLSAASGVEGAVAVVSDGIVERLASLLAVSSSEIDPQRFGFGGIDSLVAMEFRAWIVKELKAEVLCLMLWGQRILGL